MPQVKIHVAKDLPEENKRRLVEEVREIIPEALGINPRIGQVMLYEFVFRAGHATRDPTSSLWKSPCTRGEPRS